MSKGTPHKPSAAPAALAVSIIGLGRTVSSRRDRERREHRAETAVAARYGQGCEKRRPNRRRRGGAKFTPELQALSNKERRAVAHGVRDFFRGLRKWLAKEERKAKRRAERAARSKAKAAYAKRQAAREAREQRRNLDKLRKSGEMQRIRDSLRARFPGCELRLRPGQPIPKGTPWWQPVVRVGNSHCGTQPESSASPGEHDKQQKLWAVKRFRECFKAGLRERRAKRAVERHGTGYSDCVPAVEAPVNQGSASLNILISEQLADRAELEQHGDDTQRERLRMYDLGMGWGLSGLISEAAYLNCVSGWRPTVRRGEGGGGCGFVEVPPAPPATKEINGCVLPSSGGTLLF